MAGIATIIPFWMMKSELGIFQSSVHLLTLIPEGGNNLPVSVITASKYLSSFA